MPVTLVVILPFTQVMVVLLTVGVGVAETFLLGDELGVGVGVGVGEEDSIGVALGVGDELC